MESAFPEVTSGAFQESMEDPVLLNFYEERLRKLKLFRMKKKGSERDLIHVYKYLKGGYAEDGARLFSVELSDRTTDSGHKGKNRCC